MTTAFIVILVACGIAATLLPVVLDRIGRFEAEHAAARKQEHQFPPE